ncbi:MAG: flagellar hook assembly protein FlgD [Burkholderiales bacterium]
MSNINAVTSTTYDEVQNASTRSIPNKSNDLDINDFLKLLIAQMTNQDPVGGGSSRSGSGSDYIAQLAQFTMLQQLSTLSTSMSSSQAYSLIGKYVYLQESPGAQLIFGKVDGVVRENGVNCLMVGGETYDMSKVYAVADGDEEIGGVIEDQILGSAHLIGKHVTAKVTGEDGNETTITGIVEKIKVKDGDIYLVVGGRDVELGSLTEIAGEQPALNN